MPFEPSRRTVTIGLGGAALLSGTSLARPFGRADIWRAACLATERTWIDEAAAIERIIAQGVEHPNDRYHEGALSYWRLADAIGARRSETIRQRLADRYPMRLRQLEAQLDNELAKSRRIVAQFEADQVRWKQLAATEGMQEHAVRIDAAERDEAALAATILAEPAAAHDEELLQTQVTNRIADMPELRSETDVHGFADVLGAEKPGAAVSGSLTAAIIVRRLEALGYSVAMGGHFMLYDWHTQPETAAMRRRAGRLIACARSIPDMAAEAIYFRSTLRFDEAQWWMGPRPGYLIA